jgi:tol-pal system protein YbgF
MKRLTHRPLGIVVLVFSLMAVSLVEQAAATQAKDTSRHLYDRVMEEFKHRDYEAALAGFRLFLELHGQTSLAANAQYWVGECQFRMGRYKEALKSFYNVVSYHPLSPKLVSSTLKIGQTYSKLKDHEKARLMYERVVDQYPDSPEAELARKALEADAARAEPAQEITEHTVVPSIGETTSSSAESDATVPIRDR